MISALTKKDSTTTDRKSIKWVYNFHHLCENLTILSDSQEKVRVFSESFKDFYSFLLCPDCTFKGLRRNHRFVSVLFEVSNITQH